MRKLTSFFVLLTFVISCVMPPQGFTQSLTAISLMPVPGTQVGLTAIYTPAYLKGMVIDPTDPFKFDFIIYRGDEVLMDEQKQAEYAKLIKYFLASLAVPDTEQWVNLSPYEQERIIPDNFGLTEMGRDLLAQDYLLKQISSSLTNPETDLGKKFWDSVYAQAYDTFGTTDIPTDTFNKIWITPDKAVVYEKGNTVYVLEHHLKVMLEKDYLATRESQMDIPSTEENEAAVISQRVMKEVIIPAIEKEVNEGKNFAPVRQVYSGMLLASWYKLALKESILGKIYADRGKVKGVDQDDPANNQKIYAQYVEAFKKGVFNMIKEDVDMYTQEIIPRKYFSGGLKNDYAEVVRRVTDDPVAERQVQAEASKDDVVKTEVKRYTAPGGDIALNAPAFVSMMTPIGQWRVSAANLEVAAQRSISDVMAKLSSNGDKETFGQNLEELYDYYSANQDKLSRLITEKTSKDIPVTADSSRTVSFYSDNNAYDLLRVLEAGIKGGDREAFIDYVNTFTSRRNDAVEQIADLQGDLNTYPLRNDIDQQIGMYTPVKAERESLRNELQETLHYMQPLRRDRDTYRFKPSARVQELAGQDVTIINEAIAILSRQLLQLNMERLMPAIKNMTGVIAGPSAYMTGGKQAEGRSTVGGVDSTIFIHDTGDQINITQKVANISSATTLFVEEHAEQMQEIRNALALDKVEAKSSSDKAMNVTAQKILALQGDLNTYPLRNDIDRQIGMYTPVKAERESLRHELQEALHYMQAPERERERYNSRPSARVQELSGGDTNIIWEALSALHQQIFQIDMERLMPAIKNMSDVVIGASPYMTGGKQVEGRSTVGGVDSTILIYDTGDQIYITQKAANISSAMVLFAEQHAEQMQEIRASLGLDKAEEVIASYDQQLERISEQLARLKEQRESLSRVIDQSRETDYSSEMTFAQINEMQNDRLLRMDRLDRDIASAEKERADMAREKAKAAVQEQAKYGGIDMNAANLDMQIKRDGAGVPLPIGQQDLEGIRIDGLVPVILNIQPAAGVPLFS